MPYIFVSHAGQDKPRLTPFLDALLRNLPDDVSIWIDRPDDDNLMRGEIFSFDHARVKGIPTGQEWDDAIEKAVGEATGVLLFWSNAASDPSKTTLKDEINVGWREGKLVPVALEPECVPKFWFKNQLTPVWGDDGVAKFDRAIDSLRGLFDGRSQADEMGGSRYDIDKLPYRVDRDHHVREICTRASAMLSREIEPTPDVPLRRAVFVVPCTVHDAFDELIERIASKDGPDYCGLADDKSVPRAVST